MITCYLILSSTPKKIERTQYRVNVVTNDYHEKVKEINDYTCPTDELVICGIWKFSVASIDVIYSTIEHANLMCRTPECDFQSEWYSFESDVEHTKEIINHTILTFSTYKFININDN